MANKISEDTQVQLDLKTIGIIVVGAVSIASVLFRFTIRYRTCKAITRARDKKIRV